LEIRQLIKKTINEALGVPNNLYETSVLLYNKMLPKLKNITIDSLNDDEEYTIGFQDKFRIADFEFSKVFITFHFKFIQDISKPEILSMSVESESEKTKDARLKMIRKKTLKLNIKIILPSEFEFENLTDYIKSVKNEMIESLSHELKHSYDAFKKMYDDPIERAIYNAVSGKQFGIWTIDRFLHDIYYTTVNESLVRPSEVAAAIRNNQISQKEFLKFLRDSETYKNLKRISEFSYEKFRSEIGNEMEKVNSLLKHLGFKVKKMSDEKKIDEVLRLIMVNVSNWSIEELKNILTSNFIEIVMGFEGQKAKIFNRFMRRMQGFKSPEEFFKFYEKLFHEVGEKMIRKIAKLYAITEKK
jgi:cell fate (sporulation/competence/biofilm development) regulator YlbF (YheA/YmcA/DUF963 family)